MSTHIHNSMDEAGNVLRYANSKGLLIQNVHGVFYHAPQLAEGAARRDLEGVSDIHANKAYKWTALTGIKKQEEAQAAFMSIYRRYNSPMKGKVGTRGKDKGGRQKNPLKNAERKVEAKKDAAGKASKPSPETLINAALEHLGVNQSRPTIEEMLDRELAAERAIILALMSLEQWQRVATLNAVAARFQLTSDGVPHDH